ncbi:MAG: hypothetical protein IKB30_06955 [Clostridia bacterium]|nr:hypothetical protein [Clostridia bacterium]
MFKKIIALLLTVCTIFATFSMTACSEEKTSGKCIVFNSFENFEKDMQSQIRMLNNFGVLNINFDEDYVKFGNGSAKIEPSSGTNEKVTPSFIIPTYSSRYEYDYKDFTKMEKISVWMYNAQTEPYTFGIGLQIGPWTTGQWWDRVDRTTPVYYTLNNGWNYIEYNVDPTYLAFQGQSDITDIHGLVFEFEYSSQFADVPVLYMDDIRFHYLDKAVKGSQITIKADEENGVWTIADFEETIQNQYFYMRKTDVNNLRVNAKVVNALKHNTTTTNGHNVLELTKHSGDSSSGWPRATLSGKVIKMAIDKIGQDIIEHPENYELRFDYFNASPVAHNFNIMMSTPATNNEQNLWQGASTKPFTWAEWSMDFATISKRFQDNVDNPENSMALNPGYTEVNFAAAPGDVIFSTQGFGGDTNTRDRIYLIDNVRIVKKAVTA